MQTKIRCGWCEKDDLYRDYHDNEWGNPVYDDATLFEFLLLETFQAGLSWYTILSKRPISKRHSIISIIKKSPNTTKRKSTP
jgi:3-methyladenine DNA glycosylase Tag